MVVISRIILPGEKVVSRKAEKFKLRLQLCPEGMVRGILEGTIGIFELGRGTLEREQVGGDAADHGIVVDVPELLGNQEGLDPVLAQNRNVGKTRHFVVDIPVKPGLHVQEPQAVAPLGDIDVLGTHAITGRLGEGRKHVRLAPPESAETLVLV